MKSSQATSFFASALLVTGTVWLAGGCNCGGVLFPDGGGPCALPSDCRSDETCVNQVCVPRDGGTNPGQDGGTNDGGGSGSDGGCQGLQCQQVACPDGGTTTLTGSIYDPSGQVPLYNATVYVPNADLTPFTPGVSCDVCGASISGQPIAIALTGSDGRFTLRNVPTGTNIPLVMQMGRWRRKVMIPSVPACQSTPITDVGLLHMPRNRSEGDIPHLAIASGDADPFECLLRKIGIDDAEITPPSGGGRVHFYRQNGLTHDAGSPPGSSLYRDAGTLAQYDVVMLPCEGGENLSSKTSVDYRNLVDYTNAGGRLFITHYGYVWVTRQNAGTGWPATADWQPDPNRNHTPPNPFTVTLDTSFPKGAAFADWLFNVSASTTHGELSVAESRNDVQGIDGGVATRWLYGSFSRSGTPYDAVEHLTFNTPVNPAPLPDGDAGVQCGRVVFSDFHVTTAAIVSKSIPFPQTCKDEPLDPQEKALVFMLFDLSACVQDDDTAPSVCSAMNDGCTLTSQCCTGLVCMDPLGFACGGAGCTCQVPFN